MSISGQALKDRINYEVVIPSNTFFYCTSCDWSGACSELAFINGFSICPCCSHHDIRERNTMVSFT